MKPSLKVLHIGKFYSPYSGGMESVVQDLCEGLSQYAKNIEVDVLCSHTEFFTTTDTINGIRVKRLGSLGVLFGQSLMWPLLWSLPLLSRRYDILHIHSPNPLVEFLCLFLPRRKKIVCTYHADVIRQKILKPFYRPIIHSFLKRCRCIYVATENHIKYSEILPEYKDKCQIIPFGIEESRFEGEFDTNISSQYGVK